MADVTNSGLERVVAALDQRREEMAHEALRQILDENPVYARIEDPDLHADIREHVAAHIETLSEVLARERPMTADDVAFIGPHAAMRARMGIPLADFLQAFRIGHRVVWDVVLDLAEEDDAGRDLALTVSRPVMEFVNRISAAAAEAYIEAQQFLLAEGDRVRRDLLADLLAGRPPPAGARAAAARAAGIEPASPCVVVAAAPVGPPEDEHALRAAASGLARAAAGAVLPLTVIRQDEIVIVRTLMAEAVGRLSESLRQTARELADQQSPLAIGISTVHDTPDEVPEAYEEACLALELLGSSAGVLSLGDLSAFDYLALRADATARRLISPAIREFVAEDAAGGGALTATLLEYAASDLNAKRAAERLFIHINTAHYRLGKIAERTGTDMRKLSDVLELLIAVKLAGEQQ